MRPDDFEDLLGQLQNSGGGSGICRNSFCDHLTSQSAIVAPQMFQAEVIGNGGEVAMGAVLEDKLAAGHAEKRITRSEWT